MKYYYIKEYDHDELFNEYIVRGEDFDTVVEKYIDFRVKNYQEEITTEINKEPNTYGIYTGEVCVIYVGELYEEFDITIRERKFENDILNLNY